MILLLGLGVNGNARREGSRLCVRRILGRLPRFGVAASGAQQVPLEPTYMPFGSNVPVFTLQFSIRTHNEGGAN